MSLGAESFIFSLLSKNIKMNTYRIIILFVVDVYGCETWSVTLREKHRQRGKTFVTPKNAVCLLSFTLILHVSALLSYHLQAADTRIPLKRTTIN